MTNEECWEFLRSEEFGRLAFHLAEEHGRRVNAGITLPLARDRESLDLLVPRVREVMQRVPSPFLLENNTYYFDIDDSE